MSKKIYVALAAALIGLTACGNQSRQKAAEAVAEGAAAVQEKAMELAAADSIKARFQGSDGMTKRIYWVDAVFYPEAFRAKLTIGDKVYELEQYPTADGYGYRNAEVDLRGKGTEADLTYTDTNIRPLKLKEAVE